MQKRKLPSRKLPWVEDAWDELSKLSSTSILSSNLTFPTMGWDSITIIPISTLGKVWLRG